MTAAALLCLVAGGLVAGAVAVCTAHLDRWARDVQAAREADRMEALAREARAIVAAPTCDNTGGP